MTFETGGIDTLELAAALGVLRPVRFLLNQPEDSIAFAEELQKIYSQPPVWRRIWIVQEIALARELQVIHGVHSFPWTTTYTELEATDFRDRICELLSVTNRKLDFKPDYSKSVIGLQMEVARATIIRDSSLELLTLGTTLKDDEEDATAALLPSWVPKLHVDSVQIGSIDARASGVYVDTMIDVSSSMDIHQWTMNDYLAAVAVLEIDAAQGMSYFNGESLIEAYCKAFQYNILGALPREREECEQEYY
ncbi:hypothetical protein BDZ45DRAFT_739635 [Acephala macrosclerotiorum]|nr:hypothetical protein BDZ45DRAFT_739635 [Acephala macrosclerotiorum]